MSGSVNNLIILFCVIPLAAGLLSVPLVGRSFPSRVIGTLSFASTFLLAVYFLLKGHADNVIYTSQMGQWSAPFGITIVFDNLSGLLLATASAVALGSYIHSHSTNASHIEHGYFHPLIQLLMFGVNLSFLTGDLFNLFVAFEIMLMASYALLTIGTTKKQMAQAYKYVMLNLLASTVFVIAAGMAYGMLGTLNMADMALIVKTKIDSGEGLPTGFTALALMFLFVFGLKGAFFPLWFWLPDTYYTVPISIAGLFGGMLTKVGVYAVVRTFPLIFAQSLVGVPEEIAGSLATRDTMLLIIAVSAAFTMFLGVLGAVSQHEIRRILSIHVISQVGYMVFGLAIMTGWALAGCIFYMIQHMVVKCSLFLCCGIMEKHAGTDDLDKLGGLLKRDTKLAVLFFVAAMSLVGLPPLSGFFGKMVIIWEGWNNNLWWLSIIGLATGALTLLSMLKIWSYGFWNPTPAKYPHQTNAKTVIASSRSGYLGISMLVVLALFLGFGAGPIYKLADRAGNQLVNPEYYINAVLPPQRIEFINPEFAQKLKDSKNVIYKTSPLHDNLGIVSEIPVISAVYNKEAH
ncbi:Na(+)/H(+) antiporter subunit D [Poriferisphaera corsica]|uniref:Na(+)/H(+) antiporter subunit D n=1 Tax=Poriferisphaera corsica TaxID=2528020 RepID=A0A517YUA9_9BACT|nr:proton-conducting transporter membrane subunit [Poriferisphaera corsica]QDU33798.1 Na(+)/H(+) antiporter subunit D [Poriferisphaera corsica]